MSHAFMNQLKEALEATDGLGLERVKQLTQESTEMFSDIAAMLASQEPDLQEKAATDIFELKQFIEGQMEKIVEKSGMHIDDFIASMQDTLNNEDRESIMEIQKMENNNTKIRKK